MASPGTDLEAKFRLRVFALLSSAPALHQLIQSKSNTASSARIDLARFLAAYYLGIDLARLFEQLNRCHHVEAVVAGGVPTTVLPNLMVCAELDDGVENFACHADRPSSSSAVWDRSRLGQLLPSECSPNFALRLLLREQRCLEAIFFADHFNDSRTSMALRFLVDRHIPGLCLLAQYCRATLIDQLLDTIEFDEFDANEKRTHQFIEAIIQTDVLFSEEFGPVGLLNECLKALASRMVAQFAELLEPEIFAADVHSVDELLKMPSINTVKCLSPLLPRPPIYCANYDFGITPPARHTLDTETSAWVMLQACCSALAHALARSNRLEQMIGFFALWMGRQNGDDGTKSDVPFLLEAEYFTCGHSDAELAIDLDIFQTLISIALAMELRDKLVRYLADEMPNFQNGMQKSNLAPSTDDIIQQYHAKFCALATPFYGNKLVQKEDQLIWPSLRRWAHLADQSDIESAMLFLHTIQQQNVPTRRFLPPLNAQNRPKWCSLLLMDASSDHAIIGASSNWVGHLEVFVDEEQKFKLVSTDFARLRFLAHRFQMVPLRSQPIQILLHFDPNEICTVVDEQPNHQIPYFITQSINNDFNNTSNDKQQTAENADQAIKKCGDDDAENEDSLNQLIAQIRTSLDMLNGGTPNGEPEVNLRQNAVGDLNLRQNAAGDLNLRQNGARSIVQEEDHPSSSSGDETYLAQIRARHHDKLIKKRKKHGRRKVITTNSTSSTTSSYERSGKSSTSSSRTSRGTIRRRKLLANQIIKQNVQRIESTSSKPAVFVSEEPSDEQLMNEMDTIEQRLEWIRQQFEQRTVEGQIDEAEMPSPGDEEGKLSDENGKDAAIKMPSIEDRKAKFGDQVEKMRKLGTITEKTSQENSKVEKPAIENAEQQNAHQQNAETIKTTLETTRMAAIPVLENGEKKPHLNSAKEANSSRTTSEHEEDFENRAEQSQIGSAKADNPSDKNEQIDEKLTQVQKNAEIGSPQQNAEIGLRLLDHESDRSFARQSPPSSAGYHSSRPSTSQNYSHDEERIVNAKQNAIRRNQNAKIGNVPMPPMVEPMDFRGLRSSDEGEEMEQQQQQLNVQQKKPKIRSWKEIEVFPRNSPSNVEKPTILVNKCAKSMSKTRSNANYPNKNIKAEAAQQMPRRSPWRRPQWLRLLPPFDGTIRTERQTTTAQIKHGHPLLELKLDEHFSTPRGTDKEVANAGDGVGTFLTNPGRCRRTFLELAAKKERRHRSQNSSLITPKTTVEHQQQQKQQQQTHNNGIYDSGIGLEQQQQQQQQNNNGTSRNGIVLYTVELDEADVAAMRRRAEGRHN
ncbi:hypothetical protein niasHT_025278 [Heterodera trifolii]|uniref:Uncharacterized protein n=1 Tax=Heterodera trifolii TaxID=157864 RepID=A0ABD2KA63_9BILA